MNWPDTDLRLRERARPQDQVIRLPPTIPEGLRDLGDIRLAPRPLIAAGVLLTPSGSNSEWPTFELFIVDPSPQSERSYQAVIQDRWRLSPRGAASPEGFEIRGYLANAPPGARLRIRIKNRRLISDWLEFSPGADDLVLETEMAATVVGKFRLPDGMNSRHAKFSLRRQGATRADDEFRHGRLSNTGSFAERHLRSGLYALGLATAEGIAPLIVREFELSSGETLALGMLDVSEILHRYEFRARDSAGAPLTIVGMLVGQDLAGTVMGAHIGPDPRLGRMAKTRAQSDPSEPPRSIYFDSREKILVELRASSGRRQRVMASPGITSITFPTIIKARIHLPTDELDCPGLITTTLHLVPLAEGAGSAQRGRAEVMDANRHRFELPHAGLYRLDLQGTVVDESSAEVINFRVTDIWRLDATASTTTRDLITIPIDANLRARVLQAISAERMK
jgi:hypothetical protein